MRLRTDMVTLCESIFEACPLIAQLDGGQWMEARCELEAFIVAGPRKEQVTEYARELGGGLPATRDPVACAQQAVQQVVREV